LKRSSFLCIAMLVGSLGCSSGSGGTGGGAGGGGGGGGSGGGKAGGAGGGGSATGVVVRAELPSVREGLASAAVNGIVFAFGGADPLANPLDPHLGKVDAYDPTTNAWTMKVAIPTRRSGLAAVTVGNLVYVIGGDNAVAPTATANVFHPLSTIESYDPNTNNWLTRAPMPTARERFAAAAVGKVIYVFGGLVPNGTSVKSTASVEAYDTMSNSWSAKTPLTSARNALGAAVVNGIVYVIGGRTDGTPSELDLVEAYDPVADAWTTKAPLLAIRGGLSAAPINGKIYAVVWNYGYTTVEAYDPVANSWNEKPALSTNFASREWFSMTVVGNTAYVLGGFDSSGAIATVQAMTP
jgi:N-acetylneuraminic acid mutarotase